MAVWEFDLSLVPREWAATHRPEELINEEGMTDAGTAWRTRSALWSTAALELSSRLGPPSYPIANDDSWLIWNDPKQSRFDLFHEKGIVESFSVRIDARSSDEDGRQRVLDIARSFDCVLSPLGGSVFLASTIEALNAAYSTSLAAAYVRDPAMNVDPHHVRPDAAAV